MAETSKQPAHWRNAEREVIKAVEDGIFTIDDAGRIWRRSKGQWRRAEHHIGKGSYLQVRRMKDGKRHHAMAHRLVWQHLHGDIPEGMSINHLNGIKDDNRSCNLALATLSEQGKHAHRSGLRDQHGQYNPAVKLTDSQVAKIRLAYAQGGYTMQQIADRFGCALQTVSKIVRGERRPKQGGPTLPDDNRHSVCDRDPVTGRFVRREAIPDGLMVRQWPEVRS
ncbi:MAG: HNH endonuclease [Pseudomonadota bacterium]|nr:HNH endonuclease [Pseudomonadota bacterium]